VGDKTVVPALVQFARVDDDAGDKGRKSGLSTTALMALGTLEDDASFPPLHGIIEDAKLSERLRSRAIFALSHYGDTPPAEFAYLRNLYPRFESDELKEAVIQGMQQDE